MSKQSPRKATTNWWRRKLFPIVLMTSFFEISSNEMTIAEDMMCPFPNQHPTLIVQLFFGQNIKNRRQLSPQEWRLFLRNAVTPRFPDGFTVYDASGQWMNPQTQAIGREKTKVIVIAAQNTPEVRHRIEELSSVYRKQYHQQSVGIITSTGCGAFN